MCIRDRFRHSSPSFGSQRTCSTADPSQKFWSGHRCSPWQRSQFSLSLRARVCHPNTRMHVRLLGPCFKTGRLKLLCQHPKHVRGRNPAIKACWDPQSQPLYTAEGYNTPKGATFPQLLSSSRNWCWPINKRIHQAMPGWSQVNATNFKRFPFSNFTYCLTLFPKFFSSFPHGTCSLSVSRLYLALDGIYHPFWAAFPNNSTLWKRITKHW